MQRQQKFYITTALSNTINQHPEMQTPQAQEQIARELEIAYNKVNFLIKTDPENAFSKILKEIDNHIEEAVLNKEFQISCKKGCSACCHIPVDIHQAEAKEIVRYCKNNNITIDTNYLKKQNKLKPFLRRMSETYSACVFLKDGLCSIYPVRPINCRKYMVVTHPDLCGKKYYKRDKKSDGFTIEDPKTNPGIIFIHHVEVLLSAVHYLMKHDGPMGELILKHL